MPVGGNRFDHRMVPDNLRIEPIPFSGCWVWMGKVDRHGYGRIFRDGKEGFAHRFSWRQHRGEIPAGLGVLHRCDVTGCVNPDHLFLGTHTDNMRDMFAKGRRSGEKHAASMKATLRGRGENGRTTLTESAVREIMLLPGTVAAIARKFGVSPETVRQIRLGLSWRHITRPEEFA
jgi:hypothetical protein